MTFWYGLGFADISNMPMAAIQAYLINLPVRQAELKLLMAEVESIPNMKKQDRESLLKDWMQTARVKPAVRKATPGILKLLGIGVHHVH